MNDLVSKIDNWIDETLDAHYDQMISCKFLYKYFGDFYTEKFLSECVYVVVDSLPKPDFPELREAGFGGLLMGTTTA